MFVRHGVSQMSRSERRRPTRSESSRSSEKSNHSFDFRFFFLSFAPFLSFSNLFFLFPENRFRKINFGFCVA